MSLAGKVNHYCNLVGGKYESCMIFHVHDMSKKDKLVMVEKQSRILMVWWQLNLMALAVEGHLFWILRSTACSQPCVVPRHCWGSNLRQE